VSVQSENTTARRQPALGQIQFWLACLFMAGWTGVVCGGLAVQFVSRDYPCPLCMVQRMFMLLAGLGGGFIVRNAMNGDIEAQDYATGWGLTLIGCTAGGFASWRQTMLHILPGDPGYGSPVLGLHLYVWALVLFVAAIAVIGVVLSLSYRTAAPTLPAVPHRMIGRICFGFVAVVIATNLVSIFAFEGLHWFLPDDPDRYRLFYDLHLLGD
jgi:disulfide bond formation protein DsbB